MSLEELFRELKKLNRLEKLYAMQVLVAALRAEEEVASEAETNHEQFAPYDNEAAAQLLDDFLKSEQKKRDA